MTHRTKTKEEMKGAITGGQKSGGTKSIRVSRGGDKSGESDEAKNGGKGEEDSRF